MKNLAKEVKARYGTNDPFEISAKAEVVLVKEPLGNIQGYYNNAFGKKFIHLNDEIQDYFLRFVIAHLLYRVFTNSGQMMFLKNKTTQRFTKDEARANMFAINLLFTEEELKNSTGRELFDKYGISKAEEEDLFGRLYRIWDPEHKMNKEELFRFILSRTS